MNDFDSLDAIQKGLYAHTEGFKTEALGNASHAEGQQTKAMDNASHAQGRETVAYGKCSHAQGFRTKALGDYSVAMGANIEVAGEHSMGIQLKKGDMGCLTQENTLSVMGGKVGVGTLCPKSDFEVDGDVGVIGGKLIIAPTNTCSECDNESTSSNKLQVHGNAVFMDGKVGVGILEPTSDLEVHGDSMFVGDLEVQGDLTVDGEEVALKSDLLPRSVGGQITLNSSIVMGNNIDVFNFIITANSTLSPPVEAAEESLYDGKRIMVRVTQDATGSRLLTLGGSFNVPVDYSPFTLSTAADTTDIFVAVYDANREVWDVVDFKKGF